MPELFLLRHAKSDWGDPGLRDVERPLNARGREAAQAMGRHLDTLGTIDQLWVSPATRVEQTIEGLRASCPGLPEPQVVPSLYGASADTLIMLARQARGERLMIVGHNPGLHDCAFALVRGQGGEGMEQLARKFPTAALARIGIEGDWPMLDRGRGRLLGFTRPKDL
ncbi:SixA phosphatase family protein [Sphingomicrobium aestuariivivum]|uniref:SixA phosphatase family protein n=1 Tax=Sphingomicrobium aestuariivivum TaxID=1582356 RepID=UPI001FD6B455|nr:histidine phosphatase family protein [Sphingomicrobium aestuariivivum]MCJ8191440.1 histidine phosphatase family protein [Sphingomicrobium aestuariivivum]